ncbi:hypothetical protein RJ639_046179 [Escallonia herrerae]|uniref:Uncharacterized protein n=1 Tax=Escallonia herrerae TaxID=1293975 RepID=A0AA89B5E3_9ASTE|nr:hypothetical protein RJ639_046179 [Escallonia herrerae]
MMVAGAGDAPSAEELPLPTSTTPAATTTSQWSFNPSSQYQHLLDKSTPFVLHRWIALSALATIYVVRVCWIQGFYLVSYALGIFILNLLIQFLSPRVDPGLETAAESNDGPILPVRSSDEYRPFVRRLPEFKFWLKMFSKMNNDEFIMHESPGVILDVVLLVYAGGHGILAQLGRGIVKLIHDAYIMIWYLMTKAFCIAFLMTFFAIFDVPVFWPILLIYWVVLFFLTMRKQIEHMVKHKYVPFSLGKQRYGKKREPLADNESLLPED